MRFSSNKRIYLDYASSTPVSARAIRVMRKAEKLTGNPNAIHGEGVAASRELEKARTRIAAELGCKAREIIFTSGITESNNLAILGFARPQALENTHWIVSAIEHASVLKCFEYIEELGGKVTRVKPDHRGLILPEAIEKELRKETVFVSVGWANNEIGTIQPQGAIGLALAKHEKEYRTKVIFHSDAGQGPLYLPSQVHSMRVDLFSLGSSKLYGPHGIGALYMSNRAELVPIILGGGQERGMRSGTENVALAAGFAEAMLEASEKRESESRRLRKLREQLAAGIKEKIPGAIINGELKHALPHMLNISIPNVQSEYLVLALDKAGIAVSTKSACEEGESASHVVAALGDDSWKAQNTLRCSLGRGTTTADIKKAISILINTVRENATRRHLPTLLRRPVCVRTRIGRGLGGQA